MTVIALPTGFCPNQFSMRLATVQRAHSSPFGGSEQVVDMLNDRWVTSMTLPNKLHSDAAKYEAFAAALRGMTNTVDLYHFVRQVPRGTMRGTPTVINLTLQGSSYVVINAAVGTTLLAGDLVGIGGLLLMVAFDTGADPGGSMGITLVNRLRRDIAAGTPVVWDRPSIPFRMTSSSAVQYIPGYAEGLGLDFSEAI